MAFFSNLDAKSDIKDITFNDRPRLGPMDKTSQEIFRAKSSFSAPIKEELKPIFHYLKKLTISPSKLVESNVQKVIRVGWSEEDLYEAIFVGCLFNFYNRLLYGHGLKVTMQSINLPVNSFLKMDMGFRG